MISQRKVLIALVATQVVVIGLAVFLAFGALGSRGRDEFRSECRTRGMDGRVFCTLLASDVFANRNKLDGKLISLTGYLANDRGVLTIYPTELDYRLSVNTHALIVRDDHKRLVQLMREHGNSYVRLSGQYVLKDETSWRYGKMGIIRPEHVDDIIVRSLDLGADDLSVTFDPVTGEPVK